MNVSFRISATPGQAQEWAARSPARLPLTTNDTAAPDSDPSLEIGDHSDRLQRASVAVAFKLGPSNVVPAAEGLAFAVVKH